MEQFIRIRNEDNRIILESIHKTGDHANKDEWDVINMVSSEQLNTLPKEKIDENIEFMEKKKESWIKSGLYEEYPGIEEEQAGLTPDQQKWIDKTMAYFSWYGKNLQHALFARLTDNNLPEMSNSDFARVLKVVSEKVIDKEGEDVIKKTISVELNNEEANVLCSVLRMLDQDQLRGFPEDFYSINEPGGKSKISDLQQAKSLFERIEQQRCDAFYDGLPF